jgi:hypothetical protein
MPVIIDEFETTVDVQGGGQTATPATPLPAAREAWRAQWLALRAHERAARLAAHDRDDSPAGWGLG